MTDDDVRSLLAAYALDAVDDDERRAVEDLVARDADAAAELDELRAVAAAIADADAVAPPPALRATVLDQIARIPQLTAPSGSLLEGGPRSAPSAPTSAGPHAAGPRPDRSGFTAPPQRIADAGRGDPRAEDAARGATGRGDGGDSNVVPLRRRPPRVVGWGLAAAAAAVVAVTVPGVVAWQQHDRAVRAEARADLLTDLLAEPGARVLSGSVTGGGDAVAILTEARGAVVVEDLPDLADDRVYQVWAMRDGTPVPAGFLDTDGASASEVLEDYRAGDGVALSVEPAGGSEQPTTTPLVVLIPG
ncbi:anti-sigma factor [Actinotalea sp. Marseille-Q4924]|uniref:anti-sigma factor n=1 Tax=Actinotalea sp. Marseille-Q4924 TaxID=2866571 RepID=UPI001CE48708|nr:anti-sigma factor [Actinotalea sp. Marseille-Q4924]